VKNTLIASIALAAAVGAHAQTYIGDGHVDIGIGYEASEFDLHVHQEFPIEAEYAPDEAIFLVGSAGSVTSPGGAFAGVLGPAGAPAWVIPSSQVAGLPFLGFGSEELTDTDWLGNISLKLTAVNGPGAFSIWSVGSFGAPTVLASSADGLTPNDQLSLIPGSHGHFNLGFTQPGTYEVTFEAAGVHATDGAKLSTPATYRFEVVPEPSTWALLGLGTAALLFGARRVRR
jgi:surface-anchored protein